MPRMKTLERVAAITATLHDGTSMIVLNAGRPVTFAASSLEFLESRNALETEPSGRAAAPVSSAKKRAAKAERAPADPALGDARKRHKALFGKYPGPKATVPEIDAKIAAKQAADAAGNGGGSGEEAAPAS